MIEAKNVSARDLLTEEERAQLKEHESKYDDVLRTRGRVEVEGVDRTKFPRWLAVLASEYQERGWIVRLESTGHFSISHPGLQLPSR